MNYQGAKLFLGMLESIQSFSSSDDIALIEAVKEGFLALIEGSLSVELSPVGNRIMPSIYVPTAQDTKKSSKSLYPKIDEETSKQDILMWFYHAVKNKELDLDLVRYILFNPGKPMVTVNGIEDMQLPQDIEIDMSTHPLWDAVKDQVSNILNTDPNFSKMKEYFSNAVKSDARSLRNKSRTADVQNIADIVKQKDALTAQKHNVSMGSIADIAKQKEEAAEEARKLATEQSLKQSEERIRRENERKEKHANISMADIMDKIKDSEAPKTKSFADLMAARQAELDAKNAKFAKANELFRS